MKTALPADLGTALGRLRTRRTALACLRGAGVALSIFMVGVVLAGWADMIVVLPSWVRLTVVGGLLTSAAAALIYAVISVRTQATARRLAGALDRNGATGGQILAGVELAEARDPGDSLGADLRRRAIARGSELAAQQNLASAQPLTPALKPYVAAGAAFAFVALAWCAWPGLVAAQASRIFDPRADHAPLCPYTFSIQPSATAVIFGDPFEVSVRIAGADVRERFEWHIDQPGRAALNLPLLARSDGSMQGSIASTLSDFTFYVAGPRGRSEAIRIGVITVPEIRETAVKTVFPEYTHLQPVEGPLKKGGGPSGVRGTQVTLFISSNRPLSGGSLDIKTSLDAKPVTIEMKPQSGEPNVVAGTFEITGDLSFSALIRDVQGTAAKSRLLGRCLMLPDHPPRVALLEPRAKSFATPDIALPVVIETEDDFGISEILLYRSLNGSREIPVRVEVNGTGKGTSRHELVLPLREWGLDPGDVLEISALARDNDPAGAKTAQSPVHRITLITREQYLEALRQQETIDDLNERYKPWLRKLVELREKWKQARAKNDPKEIAAVRQALRETVEELEQQLKDPPVFSADIGMAKELKELQESLRKAGEDLDKGDYDAVGNGLGAADEKAKKDLEMPLDLLTKYYHLIEDAELFAAIAQAQDDLAHRAVRFDKIEKATAPQDLRDMKALGDEEGQVQSALEQLAQDIRDHAGRLPKDNPKFKKLIDTANDFATKLHDSGVDKILNDASASLIQGAGIDIAAQTRKAADIMMGLVKRGQAGMGGGASDELEAFEPKLMETVNQLLGGKGLGGQGGKGGRGYSMSHGGNTGLYGAKPARGLSKGGGNGGKHPGGTASSGQRLDDVKGFGIIDQFDSGASGGVPLSAIPSRYRSAVRDFNRRIADENAKGN